MWLQRAGGSIWKWQGATSAVQLGVGQMQSAPFAALSSSVTLNQLRKGVFILSTDALKPAGRKGRMERVRE